MDRAGTQGRVNQADNRSAQEKVVESREMVGVDERREIEEEKPLFRDSLAPASTSWKELVVVEEGPVVA